MFFHPYDGRMCSGLFFMTRSTHVFDEVVNPTGWFHKEIDSLFNTIKNLQPFYRTGRLLKQNEQGLGKEMTV
jgi:hypothetical protein